MDKNQAKQDSIKAILFDLDGTLLDSFSVHYVAYEAMFAHFGIEVTKERFLSSYSPNWYRTYEAMGLAREHWDAANSIWLAEADKHLPELLPDAREMLAELDEMYTLGIVTSGSRSRVVKDIERLAIGGHFKTIVTGDDIRQPKPAPESLLLALENLSLAPAEAVYVGDAHADFEMAQAAGVTFFGVPSEFANLVDQHPEYDICPIAALPGLIGSTIFFGGSTK